MTTQPIDEDLLVLAMAQTIASLLRSRVRTDAIDDGLLRRDLVFAGYQSAEINRHFAVAKAMALRDFNA